MNRSSFHCACLALAALALTACSSGPRLGDSVREMVVGQRHDPAAPRPAPEGFDGQAAAKAVDAYRSGQRPAPKAATPTILLPSTP